MLLIEYKLSEDSEDPQDLLARLSHSVHMVGLGLNALANHIFRIILEVTTHSCTVEEHLPHAKSARKNMH